MTHVLRDQGSTSVATQRRGVAIPAAIDTTGSRLRCQGHMCLPGNSRLCRRTVLDKRTA